MEFTHTRLLVDNFKECFLFYRDVLEFEVIWGDENSSYADFKFKGATFSLFERKRMAKAIGEKYSPDSKHVDTVALIFEVRNVEETFQQLKSKVMFITQPMEQKDWGIKAAHFRDPAGSLIEIYEPIE